MKLKNLMKKPAFLISAAFAIAAIATGCSVFYPYIGNTYSYTAEGGKYQQILGSYAGGYVTFDSSITNGCITSSTTSYINGVAGTPTTPTTSSKITLGFTEKEISSTSTSYSDTTCTLKGGTLVTTAEDAKKYSYKIKNNETKKMRTTKYVAPTATTPVTITEKIAADNEAVVVTEIEITQISHSITPATAARATALTASYNALMDNSVIPAVVMASCKSLAFIMDAATDVSVCEKDVQTADKKINNAGAQVNWTLDPMPAEIYYDGSNTRVYYSEIELGADTNYIKGDFFYEK